MMFKPDHTGLKPENKFYEEHILDADNPDTRTVILKHRPFFGKGMVIRLAGGTSPLTEGDDYQFTDEYPQLDTYTDTPVYGGIHFINKDIAGRIEFNGNHIGGTFYPGYVETMDKLIKYLNNPTMGYWPNVKDRPTLYPTFQSAVAWSDLLNKDYVASAIRDIEKSVENNKKDVETELAKLQVLTANLAKDLDSLNYPGHIAENNPHDTTPAQLGAYDVDAKVADVMLAYGKTFVELMDSVRSKGLKDADLQAYLDRYCTREVKGVLVLPDGIAITTPSVSVSFLKLDNGITISSDKGIYISTGMTSDDSKRFLEWKVGKNILRLDSSLDKFDHDTLTFNGYPLINFTTLRRYQSDEEVAPTEGLNATSDNIEFSGEGTTASPLRGTLKLPKATSTAPGIVKIVSTSSDVKEGEAVAPTALTPLNNIADDYLPNTTKVGDRPMKGTSLTFTKTDIGLGNVDNTPDAVKPISEAQDAELKKLSAAKHSHSFEDLEAAKATVDTQGIATKATTVDTLKDGGAVASSLIAELLKLLDEIGVKLKDTDPTKITNYIYVGEQQWEVERNGLSCTIRDLQYYYVEDGKSSSGRVSGTVNLSTTPMFNCHASGNNFDTAYPLAVAYNTQNNWSDLLPHADIISVKPDYVATDVSDAMVCKVRHVSDVETIRVIARSSAKVKVYIDGNLQESGQTVDQELFITPGKVVTIGFEVEATRKGDVMDLAFEILEGKMIVETSREGITRIAKKEEFHSPYYSRHYIYSNLVTGSLFSRGEPIDPDGVDPRYMLLTAVEVGQTRLSTPDTFSVAPSVDIGGVKEVARHADVPHAHVIDPDDWRLNNAEHIVPAQVMEFEPQFKLWGETGTKRSGASIVDVSDAIEDRHFFGRYKGASPLRWITSLNPNENQLTVEGSLLINLEECGDVSNMHVELILCGPNRHGVRNAMVTPVYGDAIKGIGFIQPKTAITQDMVDEKTVRRTDNRVLGGGGLIQHRTDTMAGSVQLQIKYRYIPSTGRIRTHISIYNGVALLYSAERNMDYTYQRDEFIYEGITGVQIGGVKYKQISILPTLFPTQHTDEELNRVNYYTGLFSSYLPSDPATVFNNRLTSVTTVPALSDLSSCTHYTVMEKSIGDIAVSGDVPVSIRPESERLLVNSEYLQYSKFMKRDIDSPVFQNTLLPSDQPQTPWTVPIDVTVEESGLVVPGVDSFLLKPKGEVFEKLKVGTTLLVTTSMADVLTFYDAVSFQPLRKMSYGDSKVFESIIYPSRAFAVIVAINQNVDLSTIRFRIFAGEDEVEFDIVRNRALVGDVVYTRSMFDLTPKWEALVKRRLAYEGTVPRIL